MPALGAPKGHVDCPPLLDNLCPTFSQLKLSAEKFLPGQPKASSLPGFLARPIDPVGLQPPDLGYLDEIYRKRDECPLCWLLFNATHTKNEEGADRFEWSRPNVRQAIGYDDLTRDGGRVRCSVEWQLDGRLLEPPPGRNLHRGLYHAAAPESHSTWDKTFLARTHHGSGCQPSPPDEVFSLLENLKFIDLDEEKIVTSARGDVQVTEYATLSYVWGGIQALILTKENVSEYSSKGSLGPNTPGLPNTVRDAMMLVTALGIKYIWVDALCILQDDTEEKFRVVPMMNRVYGHSILTICAAAGSGSRQGIPGSPSTSLSDSYGVGCCLKSSGNADKRSETIFVI
ncbi:heterokaryon incompatibility protein [Colletotrichum simmondsii]|uniref:Heterokaryon incompatibility protein n=1 Tax=Colletotrichum simmondsii TaxID=703756 RepID=A0A135TL17_9PEZI|nr:heterokaryon incompatibility protein [Colletotrichum simmondsii]